MSGTAVLGEASGSQKVMHSVFPEAINRITVTADQAEQNRDFQKISAMCRDRKQIAGTAEYHQFMPKITDNFTDSHHG